MFANVKGRPGNYGYQIPRDKGWLTRLYWKDELTLPMIADLYGVEHSSVKNVMIQLGIPRRKKGHHGTKLCVECGAPAKKIRHAINGSLYGRHCRQCRKEHYNKLSREYAKVPWVKEWRRRYQELWYYHGPLKKVSERSWISTARSRLRSVKRLLVTRTDANPAASRSLNEALRRVRSLQK